MDYLRDELHSSRSSQQTDVLGMKPNPPRYIDCADTISSTSPATAQASAPVHPIGEDTEKSKWKPLIGTPSKDPIPENILVPDPSTPRTVSDTDSLVGSTSSTPKSFIHNRRRGEYKSRPPAFPLPLTPTRAAPPPPSKIDQDTTDRPCTPAVLDNDAPNVGNDGNDGTGSPRPQRPPRPYASQIPSFSDLARKNPEYHRALDHIAKEWSHNHITVNAMRNPDPLAHFNSDLTQGLNQDENHPPTDFASTSSVNAQPGPSRSLSKKTPGRSQPANILRGLENVQNGSHPPNSVAEEPPQRSPTEGISTSKPTRANSTRSADHHQRGSETSGCESDHGESSSTPLGGCVSIVSTTAARSYAHIEKPVLVGPDAAAEIDTYIDLRCKPFGPGSPDWDKRIKIGSQIVFIGSTRWSNDKGEGVYDVGIPYGTQCYVARIFNDYWALCLKLERGLEPYVGDQTSRLFERFRHPKVPKVVEQGEKSFIALKNHPVVAIYAPLCAFTIAANHGPFEERREAVGTRTTGLNTWEGGIIQAANRGASSVFEDEAKRAWKVFVPLQVWKQYKSFCSESQQTTDALGNIVCAENTPSGWALVDQNLSSHVQGSSSTGRQLRSLMSKSGTIKAVKTTANRVKSAFKPEAAAVDVPSDRIEPSQKATHSVYGKSSGLAPERSNIIPPIEAQPPLRPFDDGEISDIERPLLPISINILSNPDPLSPETRDNGDKKSAIADTVQPAFDESLGGGPIQRDPHPGVEVSALAGLHPGIDFAPSGTSPGTFEYRTVSAVEQPEVPIVPVHNPPESINVDANVETQRAPLSLPLRLKKHIQGKASKVSSKGSPQNLATLVRRRFAAAAGGSQSQGERSGRHQTMQTHVANAMKSIQSSLRGRLIRPRIFIIQPTPESTTPQVTTPQVIAPPEEDIVPPQEKRRRRNTVQNVISEAWGSIRSDHHRPSTTTTPQGTTSQATEPQGTTPELLTPGEVTHPSTGVDGSNQVGQASGERHPMNQPRFPVPTPRDREGVNGRGRGLSIIPPHPRARNPAPHPQSQVQGLPEVGGLIDHLRNVAPYSGVGGRRVMGSSSGGVRRLSI